MVFTRTLSDKELKVIKKIIEFVKVKHHRAEGHDYSHVLEVVRHSIEIGRTIKEECDAFVVLCAALLHDIGKVDHPEGTFHGLDGGSRAEEFLESLIDDPYIINKIEKVIVRHTPTSMIAPWAVEERVVYDADAIERLGFMGIIRGLMGKRGTMQEIITSKVQSRMQDYDKLFFKESKKMAKKAHLETIEMCSSLTARLKERINEIEEIDEVHEIAPQVKKSGIIKSPKKKR
ncbi:HD domain-containing protein [Candidatus Woesearchaeota archaeon]|nr:HD domain-containing protein [Candidatus Woesearchaeota archaeon]